jgi:hypothetical protein
MRCVASENERLDWSAIRSEKIVKTTNVLEDRDYWNTEPVLKLLKRESSLADLIVSRFGDRNLKDSYSKCGE